MTCCRSNSSQADDLAVDSEEKVVAAEAAEEVGAPVTGEDLAADPDALLQEHAFGDGEAPCVADAELVQEYIEEALATWASSVQLSLAAVAEFHSRKTDPVGGAPGASGEGVCRISLVEGAGSGDDGAARKAMYIHWKHPVANREGREVLKWDRERLGRAGEGPGRMRSQEEDSVRRVRGG